MCEITSSLFKMAIRLLILVVVIRVEYASLISTILFSSGAITIIASLKYFFSIFSEIKNTINDTKADANSINFIFFFAINRKNLRSAKSNAYNNSVVLLSI